MTAGRWQDALFERTTLFFAMLVLFLLVAIIGSLTFLPATLAILRELRPGLSRVLKDGGGAGHGRGRQAFRAALIVAEVAVSVILLTGSLLMARSLLHLRGERGGIGADRLSTAWLLLPGASAYAQPAPATVNMTSDSFDRTVVHIAAGQTVVWNNPDADTHTVTADDGTTFDSGDVANGGQFSFEFDAPGIFSRPGSGLPSTTNPRPALPSNGKFETAPAATTPGIALMRSPISRQKRGWSGGPL